MGWLGNNGKMDHVQFQVVSIKPDLGKIKHMGFWIIKNDSQRTGLRN